MPSTINGIGTWYWGKRNILARDAVCESCGAYRLLRSYDTTLYFVVLYIPLVPLGRKRVLDECPACTRHRAVPLRKWEAQKEHALTAALESWQADKNSADKAKKAMEVALGFQDAEAFDAVAAAAGQQFARDPGVQMFLGDAQDHLGRPEAAEASYRAAVAAAPGDDAARYALAAFLLRRVRPADAQPLLADILPQRKRDRAPLLILLAQAYQAVGAHDAAGQLVDELGTAFPDLLSDPHFEQVRKAALKYRGTTKKLAVAALSAAGGKRAATGALRESFFQRHGAKLLVGTILLVAAGWYVLAAVQLGHHSVQLVNGTAAPYTVELGGRKWSVPAVGAAVARLDEGTYDVRVTDRPGIEPARVAIRTNFWKRPLNKRTFVINPDRTALVYAETVEYSQGGGGGGNDEAPPRVMVGQAFYDLDKAQDAFQQPPSSVRLSSKSSTVKRTHVDLVRNVPPPALARAIRGRLGAAAAAEYCRRHAMAAGDDREAMALVAAHVGPEEQLAFFRRHLSDRPVRVELHRIYQQAAEKYRPDHDLAAEYKAMLAAAPDGDAATRGMLTYLLGRVTEPPEAARALFLKAADGEPPVAYAHYAIGYDDLKEGNFPAALERARAARKLEPGRPEFAWMEAEALEASGDVDAAIALARSRQGEEGATSAGTGRSARLVADEARLLVRKGDRAAANARVEAYYQALSKLSPSDAESLAAARAWLDGVLHYAAGDLAAYEAAQESQKDPAWRFQVALTRERIKEAEAALNEMEKPDAAAADAGAGEPGGAGAAAAAAGDADASDALMLSVAAASAGEGAVAERGWRRALELLSHEGKDDRKIAAILSRGDAPGDDDLRNWTGRPVMRALLLTAVGQRFPDRRDALFAAARKLNYANLFPQRLIAAALDGARVNKD